MRACPHAADGWSLSAASDSVGAALGVVELGYFGDVVGGDGDYYELGDVVTSDDVLGLVAGVVEAQFDGAAIPAVDNAGAVTQHQVPFDSSTGTHKQHPYMAFWYGHMNTGVPYPVGANGHGEVVLQGEVHASITLISKPGLMRILI